MMKNMKIRTRLIVSYMIIVVFLLIAGITSIVMLSSVSQTLEDFYNLQFQTVDNAWNARRTVFSARANMFQAMLDSDMTVTRTATQGAQDDFQTIRDCIDLIETTFAGDMSLLTECETWLDQADPIIDQICELANNNQNNQAYQIALNEYKPYMDKIRDNLTEVGRVADVNATAKVQAGERLAATADVVIIVIMIISVVVSVVLAMLMAEGIRKPVQEMMNASADISRGKLDTRISYESKDELGEMANSMKSLIDTIRGIIEDVDYCLGEMGHGNFSIDSRNAGGYVGDFKGILEAFTTLRDTMNDTLMQIDVSADQVNSGGEQVSSGAQALAQGATEQAASVQELAATINSIAEQVKTTAQHAKQAETDNRHASEEIQICSTHMNDLMDAMQVINDKSKEISKVVKTIEDIAFQTNILALNAAVEAARAGSAGKGFAVVADEVRNLATKSQEAAGSTTTLIDETVKAVQNGSQLSAETDESLKKVVTDSEKVLEAVSLISGATADQSEAVAQVTTGIDQISSVVQTNSATAEQSAAASEELSAQAKLLKDLVGKFTLSRDDHQHISRPSSSVSSDDYGMPSYSGGDKY